MLARVVHGFGGGVHAGDGERALGELDRSVAGAAAGIEHALPARQARRECVARQVLAEQIGVHLIRV